MNPLKWLKDKWYYYCDWYYLDEWIAAFIIAFGLAMFWFVGVLGMLR